MEEIWNSALLSFKSVPKSNLNMPKFFLTSPANSPVREIYDGWIALVSTRPNAGNFVCEDLWGWCVLG